LSFSGGSAICLLVRRPEWSGFNEAPKGRCIAASVEKIHDVPVRRKARQFNQLDRQRAIDIADGGECLAMKITGHLTRSVFDRYDITSEADIREGLGRIATGTKRGDNAAHANSHATKQSA
jgi:hypothetical protein